MFDNEMKNNIVLPDAVKMIISRLEENSFAAYAVGGALRDLILGKEPDDWDITTDATPAEVEKIFSDIPVIETGIKHGTVTLLIDGIPFEVTTFRTESGYSDSRHPDSVKFTRRIEDDLARRDFTMNAIALSPSRGFCDPFGTRGDIENGVIRAVGEPTERFSEDALRILRALRFSSVTGFHIEEKTASALRACRERLSSVSCERLAAETNKLLCGENVLDVLLNYPDVLSVYIPCLAPMVGFEQKNPHHIYDVYTHSVRAVAKTPPVLTLRLAALLHDSGKPKSFTLDEKGVGHFRGHAAVSLELAQNALESLKYDNYTKNRVLTLIKYHDTPIETTETAVSRVLAKLGKEQFFDLLLLKRADNFAQSPEFSDRQGQYDEIEALARGILEKKLCFSLADLAVDGNDMLAIGLRGKEIGKSLALALEAVIDKRVENEKDALIEYLKREQR